MISLKIGLRAVPTPSRRSFFMHNVALVVQGFFVFKRDPTSVRSDL